jgi:hypothetical protein
MSWAKRNLYFLISAIAAVVLLGAAGWYCYSASQSNNANWDQLQQAYSQLKTLADKNPGPGNDTVTNIDTARQQTREARQRVAEMEKFFTPVPGIPNTNHFNDRALAFALHDTISQLRSSAQAHNVTLPTSTPEFAFSFTLQAGKVIYDGNSLETLSRQLGEVKLVCETLFSARVSALDAVQRERTADDANPSNSGMSANDYTESTSLTNGNIIITPYQVTFECFTPELSAVISSFANQQHSVVVKTLNIQPVDLNTAMENTAMTTTPMLAARGGLPTAVDEKKLKVIMLLDFVRILPAQGR